MLFDLFSIKFHINSFTISNNHFFSSVYFLRRALIISAGHTPKTQYCLLDQARFSTDASHRPSLTLRAHPPNPSFLSPKPQNV